MTTGRSGAQVDGLLPLRAHDLQVLLILARGPLHAYGIAKAAEEYPEARVRLEIGSLYRMLNRLLSEGLIEETDDDGTGDGRGAPRRTYRITDLGRRVAEAEAARLRRVLDLAVEHDLAPEAGRGEP